MGTRVSWTLVSVVGTLLIQSKDAKAKLSHLSSWGGGRSYNNLETSGRLATVLKPKMTLG
jgi:hypothetical protein